MNEPQGFVVGYCFLAGFGLFGLALALDIGFSAFALVWLLLGVLAFVSGEGFGDLHVFLSLFIGWTLTIIMQFGSSTGAAWLITSFSPIVVLCSIPLGLAIWRR